MQILSDDTVGKPSAALPLLFVVEDDTDIARLICHHLHESGFLTRWFPSAANVVSEAEKFSPALFLLDVMLPGEDGFELCRRIRRNNNLQKARVIFLTARTGERDRIAGLELGGDAYIIKPFNLRELVARVRSVLRAREEPEITSAATYGRIEIDLLSMTVKVAGEEIATTIREFRLLEYLTRHPSRVFTRKQLLDAVLPAASFVTERSIDVYVRRLRIKIEPDPDNPVYLKTVRGVGYRFETPRE